ncbi:MAG: caspase family protein [Verrucomicrobia bacterium]|nr:caspase family protein [Verrucomicrobiota bacterium]
MRTMPQAPPTLILPTCPLLPVPRLRGGLERGAGLFLLLSLTLAIPRALARDQIALVIGNSAYEGDARLDNPANDAKAVARELRAVNFGTVIEVIDGNREGMESALGRFLDSLGPETMGLFYYAGHGVQIDGVNYLLPVGTAFERAYDVKYKSLSLNQIMDAINEAGSLPNAVVLDCCRNNPFRSVQPGGNVRGQGLAEVANQQGTLVAFSTAAGTTAADRDAVLKDHSPYTAALLLELRGPSAGHYEMGALFRNVAQRVHQSTGQDPLLNIPGSVGNYDLKAADFIGKTAATPATPLPLPSSAAMDRIKQLELEREARDAETKAMLAEMKKKLEDLEKEKEAGKAMTGNLLATAPISPQPMPAPERAIVFSPWIFPDSDARYLSPAEIQSLGPEDRWIARNEIFARRGLIFSSPRGQGYTRSLGSAYQGLTRNQDLIFEQMNAYERSNVELIRRYE